MPVPPFPPELAWLQDQIRAQDELFATLGITLEPADELDDSGAFFDHWFGGRAWRALRHRLEIFAHDGSGGAFAAWFPPRARTAAIALFGPRGQTRLLARSPRGFLELLISGQVRASGEPFEAGELEAAPELAGLCQRFRKQALARFALRSPAAASILAEAAESRGRLFDAWLAGCQAAIRDAKTSIDRRWQDPELPSKPVDELRELITLTIETRTARECFAELTGLLERLPSSRSGQLCSLLVGCPVPESLDWIEQALPSSVGRNWGPTVAELGADWPRLAGWLARGRPHSLAALDALWHYGRLPQPMPGAASQQLVLAAVHDCARRDGAPRAEKTALEIEAAITAICGG